MQGPPGEAGPPGLNADATVSRQPQPSGPGLTLNVTGTTVDASGVVSVAFTVTDGAGHPLDYNGVYTDSVVSAKFVLSALEQGGDGGAPGAPPGYVAYTRQSHTSADGGAKAMLPDSDTGGKVTEVGAGQGTYTYTFLSLIHI